MGTLALNRILVLTLADLDRREASACVTVQFGKAKRVVHVERGHLIGAESNLKAERLGDRLVQEGVLDAALLEPIAAEAALRGTLLGHQLVTDGLLSAPDLSNALDRQVSFRLGAALSMRGLVARESSRALKTTLAVPMPLTLAVVDAFRFWVPLEAIEEQLRAADEEPNSGPVRPDALARLELGPAEARIAGRLQAGERFDDIIAAGAPREPVLRLAGALRAVGL